MFQFEGYTLDIARGSLRTADRDVQLRPKAFEVLRYLVESADRLVTKDELMRAVWPNVIVTDEVLTHCVSEARQAIGDGDQTVIKTVPRRGYRFAAPVLRLEARTAVAPPPALPVADSPPAWRNSGPPSQPPLLDRPSVAVLPFANLSGDPQQEYFSDGITEDIITELSRFSELLVIARIQASSTRAERPMLGRSRRNWAHATCWRAASGGAASASASRRSSSTP